MMSCGHKTTCYLISMFKGIVVSPKYLSSRLPQLDHTEPTSTVDPSTRLRLEHNSLRTECEKSPLDVCFLLRC